LRAEMTEAGDPLSAALEAAALDVGLPRVAHDHGDVEDLVGLEGAITEEHPVMPARREARPTRPVRPPAPPRAEAPVVNPDVAVGPEAGSSPAESAADGERRAQRRRGRRGGRRNRPSGGSSTDGSSNGSGAPSGE
jgi:hypothetical protein